MTEEPEYRFKCPISGCRFLTLQSCQQRKQRVTEKASSMQQWTPNARDTCKKCDGPKPLVSLSGKEKRALENMKSEKE